MTHVLEFLHSQLKNITITYWLFFVFINFKEFSDYFMK
jgi:hypothetical protein